jgi:type II secretory pathway pseudopilin PulG
MGDINENRDMNTNDMGPSTDRPMPTRMSSMGREPRKGPKALVWILIIILVLAGGAVAGYFYGQYQKNKEVEQARVDAQTAAQAEIDKAKAEAEKQKTAPEKTETSATCNADELSLALESADAAAGTYSYNLTFTNTSSRNCTLFGYPGVSLVNDNGNMIGSPAERTENSQELTMTLEPQGTVKAVLYAANSDNFSAGQCSEGATKLRVYPPNDTGYVSVATVETLTSWCPGFEVSPVMGM